MDRNFDTEKFIFEVQSRPSIWDNSLHDYSNRELKKKDWEDLVDLFGGEQLCDVEKKFLGLALQKRWKSIRSCYAREVKRQKNVKSGSGASNRKSEYIHFKQLQFLQQVVAIRDISETEENNSETDEEEIDIRNRIAKKRSKRHVAGDDDPLLVALSNSIDQVQSIQKAQEDEDRMFLLSLLSTLKRIPSHKKMATKIKILSVLNEASEVCSGDMGYQEYLPPRYRRKTSVTN